MAEEEAEDQKVRQSARDALDRLSSDDKVNYVIYIVLYVRMCVCVCVCVYARACMCVHVCMCVSTYVCLHTYIWVYLCIIYAPVTVKRKICIVNQAIWFSKETFL